MLPISIASLSRYLVFLTVMASLVGDDVVMADYDPMRVSDAGSGKPADLSIRDVSRERDIPVRIYLPQKRERAPVVLFSHGLGGSRTNNGFLGRHWSQRGYVAVFMQHHGSDESVWQDSPLLQRRAALKKAASLQSSLDRFKDVSAVLDQLGKWDKESGHLLSRRLDLNKVGMSGHSFGAVTTQAVSGQSFALVGQRYTDQRIDAALAFSPSPPRRGDPKKAFASVSVPWMLMTGTHDASPINDTTAESRFKVFASLPKNVERYELVLHDAEHSAFSDRRLPGDRLPRNPNHHRAIVAFSTAFWDAQLKEDAAARAWLRGPDATTMLEKKDRWQLDTAPSRSQHGVR